MTGWLKGGWGTCRVSTASGADSHVFVGVLLLKLICFSRTFTVCSWQWRPADTAVFRLCLETDEETLGLATDSWNPLGTTWLTLLWLTLLK